ncbi:HK97 family phage prohead protease [Pelagovum pacificum]|uniref:HK97 family phage prohead protease n=1 Tax=Pelagovum pacificum TaxID=2588711 RepID=A0A5C5GD83_9RHOB|nr:HK97 family phage prohead protease [Pelagovum pacificum]QQA41243.1 HK97 family phage prohead protease [Pelagovum pacificum]TNY31949.1 HK97 family phage prohead protease [Pelagovum pacificum]
MELEHKFCRLGGEVTVRDGHVIEGYASLFGRPDQGGDIVRAGAYAASLKDGRRVRMLWQHDPGQPIGVWDEIAEDGRGLKVKGRILTDVAKGREAAALLAAGAIDGLSIGYRTRKAHRDTKGQRQLAEVELWEVSLVTFPMLPEARIGAKGDSPDAATLREMAAALRDAARAMRS